MIKKPVKCQYFLTLECNMRCAFCEFPTNKKFRMGFANLEDVKTNINSLKKMGVRVVDFTGGEPLLHKDIIEILRFAKKKGMITRLSTNGLLYKKYAEELKGIVDYLVFSIHGPDKEINDKITRTRNFDTLIEAVGIAKRLRQNPEMFYVITEENFKYVKDMVELAGKLKVRLTINPVYTYFKNPGLGRQKVMSLRKYFYKSNVFINMAYLEMLLDSGNKTKNPRCRAVDAVISITPDNYVALPCFNLYFKKIKINNNLEEIYKSKEIKELRKMQGKWDFCEGCNLSCFLIPSFYYKIDKYFFWAVASGTKYFIGKKIKDVFQ